MAPAPAMSQMPTFALQTVYRRIFSIGACKLRDEDGTGRPIGISLDVEACWCEGKQMGLIEMRIGLTRENHGGNQKEQIEDFVRFRDVLAPKLISEDMWEKRSALLAGEEYFNMDGENTLAPFSYEQQGDFVYQAIQLGLKRLKEVTAFVDRYNGVLPVGAGAFDTMEVRAEEQRTES